MKKKERSWRQRIGKDLRCPPLTSGHSILFSPPSRGCLCWSDSGFALEGRRTRSDWMMEAGSCPRLAFVDPCCHQVELVSVKASYLGTSDGAMDWEETGPVGLRGRDGCWGILRVRLDKQAPGCPFICALHERLDRGSLIVEGPQDTRGSPRCLPLGCQV